MGKHLTEKERYLIEFMYNKEKRTQREIAKILNKHYNTIYNEIKRGTVRLLDRNLKEYESGVHRVQRVPETETQGRVHTSTVTVAVLPEADDVEVDINPNDLQIDTFRSSGAGGQHINKTSSAIRITHIPTGMVVECQDERSQFKNKDKALKVLKSRLLKIEQEKQHNEVAQERRSQVGTGDRSERIRTYNYPQGRVTDHRIGLTLYKIDDILNGNIDEIIDALITADRTEQLKNSE